MVGDEQTHIIPDDRAELDRLARLSGFDDTDAFGDALLAQFKLVEAHYGALFEKIPEPPTSAPGIVVADENDPATLASLEQLGFDNPAAAVGAIRAWQSGRYAATRSAKSRERLTEFLPLLLDAFGRTSEPDLALATFDKVIAEHARRASALLAACRQSEPVAPGRRHHGHGAAACQHHRPPAALARCGARSRVFRRGADAGQAQGAGRDGARARHRLSGCARPGADRRPRAGLPDRRPGDVRHDLGAAGGCRLCAVSPRR